MLLSLWKEAYLETYMTYFNKDLKKFQQGRLIMACLLFLVVIGGMLILVTLDAITPLWLLVSPVSFYLGYKMSYWHLVSLKKQSDLMLSFIFPDFLQSFIGLLPSSGNIYEALTITAEYTSEPLKSEVLKLVKKIEKENNRADYLEVAEFVGGTEAYMIMGMVYQFSEFGIKQDALKGLQSYIESLQENKVEELKENKLAKAEKHGHIPILISVFLVFGFVFAVFAYFLQDINDLITFM